MISVSNLRKLYGGRVAVDDVSFSVERGEVYGLLGPNGAGKSTTIGAMVGLVKPDGGTIRINGGDPLLPSVRSCIGLAPQALAIYEELSACSNLEFFGKLQGLGGSKLRSRVEWALELSGLKDRAKDTVNTFSGGMKRRLNLACGLVHDPQVVFLDEPTVGVDPQSRNYIFESVEELKTQGLTVIYTTHYMEEAERLCDRIAIMDNGRILAEGTLAELLAKHGTGSVVFAEFEKAIPEVLRIRGEAVGNTLTIRTAEPFKEVAAMGSAGDVLRSLRVEQPNLESVFLSLTGRSLRD